MAVPLRYIPTIKCQSIKDAILGCVDRGRGLAGASGVSAAEVGNNHRAVSPVQSERPL